MFRSAFRSKLMAQAHIVVRNIATRVARLQMVIQAGECCFDNINLLLDSLCRDVLHYREHIPDNETVAAHLLSAIQIVNEGQSVVAPMTEEPHAAPLTISTGGRPKYVITAEQLRFFVGRYRLPPAVPLSFLQFHFHFFMLCYC